jgi:hypothetical protein
LQSALNNLPKNWPKWEGSTIADVKKATEYIRENAIDVAAVCLDKKTEQWPLFWDDADSYHQKIASASKMRTGFVKAANVIRYWLFGQCSAPLIAETIKRVGMSKVLDPNGLGIVEVNIVCDSDIQGNDNIDQVGSPACQADLVAENRIPAVLDNNVGVRFKADFLNPSSAIPMRQNQRRLCESTM